MGSEPLFSYRTQRAQLLDEERGSDPIFSRRAFIGSAGLAVAAPWAFAQDIRGRALTRDVSTTVGRIRGVELDGGIQAFYGVPYGASTGGANRFLPPNAPEPWSGVRETINVGFRSPQPLAGPISEIHSLHRANPMSEDCLHVNVSTPGLDNESRPVMVWFHGGGFWSGEGDWILYDGANLARSQDVVVVTVTHRLNAFGFLYLPEIGGSEYAEASNVGMRDMVLALDWVQANIGNFGGNPDNVTIFGQSGGGGKVSVLSAMPAAAGKFHKAIVMSGSLLEGTNQANATELTRRFMEGAGAASVADLKRMPWEELSAHSTRLNFTMGPTVDGTSLPSHPWSPAAPALAARIPLMIGTTETESNFFPDTPLDPIDSAELTRLVATATRAGSEEVARLIAVYREGRPDATEIDLFQIIASDLRFGQNADTQAERKAAQADAPIYKYYFTWRSPVRDGKLKSYHCIDIPFAFNNVDVAASMLGGGQDRYALADAVSGAFAAFARSGDPNHAGIPRWAPFDARERATMIFNNEPRLVMDPHGAERRVRAELQGRA
jgi:para-nitrobenzyl esterase